VFFGVLKPPEKGKSDRISIIGNDPVCHLSETAGAACGLNSCIDRVKCGRRHKAVTKV